VKTATKALFPIIGLDSPYRIGLTAFFVPAR